MTMKTTDIWREQSFYFIEEASDWLRRDFYGDDVEGVVADLETIIEWAEDKISAYKQYALDNPTPSMVG
jgi:hypothetical protein